MLMLTPELIKAIRKNLDMSSTEFAFRLGKTANTVARWEAGSSHPTYETMEAIHELAKNAGIAVNELAEARAANGRKKVGAK